MMQIAQLIKAGVGLEVAFTDTGNASAGTRTSTRAAHAASLPIFCGHFGIAIAAFATDLGKRMDDVVVLTMSRIRPHGPRKRQPRHRPRPRERDVRCSATGQRRQSLRRLARARDRPAERRPRPRVTTDFRDVFAEAAYKHMGSKDLAKLFPNYTAVKEKFRGYLG